MLYVDLSSEQSCEVDIVILILKTQKLNSEIGNLGKVWWGQDLLEKEMAIFFSVSARRIPRTGKSGGLHSMGSLRVRHN